MDDDDRAHSRIMGLCARAELEPVLEAQLHEVCAKVPQWHEFLRRVEEQAMGPLVHRHVASRPGLAVPDDIKRGLRGLALRHRAASSMRVEALREALAVFEAAQLPALVLKGSALAHWVYPEPGLRPQRDVDLLVAREDAARAAELLRGLGYRDAGPAAPHHLAPLDRRQGGFSISIELHHALGLVRLPDYAALPEQDFAALAKDAVTLHSAAGKLRAPNAAHMLRHVYRHGLACPMGWRMFHYGTLADLALLLEATHDTLDEAALRALEPALLGALPALHRVVPLGPKARARFGLPPPDETVAFAEMYWGWPRIAPKPDLHYLFATLFPHYSFLQLRYGRSGKRGAALAWAQHLRELAHLYTEAGTKPGKSRVER